RWPTTHQVAEIPNSSNKASRRSITTSRSILQASANLLGPNRSSVPQISSKSRLIVRIPEGAAFDSEPPHSILPAPFCAHKKHIRELPEDRHIRKFGVGSFPRSEHTRECPGHRTLDPVDGPDVDTVHFKRFETRFQEIPFEPARAVEVLPEWNKTADAIGACD